MEIASRNKRILRILKGEGAGGQPKVTYVAVPEVHAQGPPGLRAIFLTHRQLGGQSGKLYLLGTMLGKISLEVVCMWILTFSVLVPF